MSDYERLQWQLANASAACIAAEKIMDEAVCFPLDQFATRRPASLLFWKLQSEVCKTL